MGLSPGGNFGNYGFVVGRVTAVAVDQNDPSGNTVYVGGANGGLWKSSNAAAADPSTVTWSPLTDRQPTLAIGAIALKPDNSQVVLVGTGEVNGSEDSYYGLGILRTADGGTTWSLISTADNGTWNFHGIGFSRIAFSADNTSLAVAAAAQTNGDDRGAVQATSRVGLYYSSDAGLTWHLASVTDNGQPITPGSATDVVYNRAEHKFYAPIRYHGVYVSSDGITWSRLASQPGGSALAEGVCPTARTTSCPLFRAAVTVRSGADEMYVWYTDGVSDLGIYQSTNGGASWTQIASPTYFSCASDSLGCLYGTQLYYNFNLKAVPTSVGTDLYIGHVNLLKCSLSSSNPTCQNGSATTGNWLNLTHVYGCTPFGAPAHVHPDEHAIEFVEANPDIIYFGNDGGIYRSLHASTGLLSGSCSVPNAFDNLDANLGSMTEFVSFSQHPTDRSTFLGGTQDNGSPAIDAAHSGANGVTWQAVAPGDGGFNAINPDQPAEWFIATHGANVLRCPLGINCTATDFQPVISATQVDFDASDFYTPYILDPQNSSTILIGTCRLWRGPSSGSGWSPANALSYNFDTNTPTVCSLSSNNIVTALAAGGPSTPNGSQVIYAGTAVGQIFVTTNADGGPSTWAQSAPSNPQGYLISSISLDDHDPSGRTAYATVMGFGVGHVFKTIDAGSNWTDISGDLPDSPADSIIVDPNDSNVLYVGTDIGVFQTLNGGVSWLEYGPASGQGSLPEVVVTQLRIFNKQELRASTYGRGVWAIPVNTFADFAFALDDPTSVTLFPSQSFSFQGQLSAFNNYGSTVTISCSASSPVPTTCQGNSVTPGATPVSFSVNVSNPSVQDFAFNILGTGSDSTATKHQLPVQVRVVDFNLSSTAPSVVALPRGTTSQAVFFSVSASGSFGDVVDLACSGLPAGATCNFTPATVSPLAGSPISVRLLITASPATPAGSFPLTIVGTTNSLLGPVTRNSPLSLTVVLNPQFVIAANPASMHTRLGEATATTTVTIAAQDGYTGTVSLSCSIIPSGPTCSSLANSFSSFPATTTVTVAANGAPAARYTLTLNGTDASGTHSVQVPFAITDFSLRGPTTASANTGDNLALPLTSLPLNGYTGNLTMTCDVSALGSQAACSVPPTLDMSAGFVTGFTLRISVPASTLPGTYAVSVVATDGLLSRVSQVQIAVVSSSAIQVTGIAPQEEEDGGIPVFMTVFGKNFTPQSKVFVDGVDYNSTFPVSSTALGIATPTPIFNQLGTHEFSVFDPKLGNSNSVPFRIFSPDHANASMQAPAIISMPAFFGGALDAVAGDFESIGRKDLAVMGGQILLFHNAGGGNFNPAGLTPYQGGNPQVLLAGDVNGDGKLDLVIVNQCQQAGVDNLANFSVLLGDGLGHFSQSGNFSLPSGPFQGALVDLNGDGKLDLLVATFGSGAVLLLGHGDGTFGSATPIGPSANFVLGHIQGKSSTDIILNGPDQIRILLNNGSGAFQEVDPPEFQGLTGDIAAGDFNGDGILDLFVQGANEPAGSAHLFLGLGNGSFTPLTEFSFAPQQYASLQYSFVVGDFDGDGKLDLAGVNGDGHPSHALFLWGKGDGTFTPQVVNGPLASRAIQADVTGDGLADLITIGGSLGIIPGLSNRQIQSPNVLFPFITSNVVRTGDINGDGLPDILVSACVPGAPCNTGGDEVFLNRGGGVFSAPIDVPQGMRLGDMNGDGLADLVGCSGTSVQIWPGDGSGAFNSAPINIPTGTSCPTDVQIVDLDHDGHLDIVGVGFILYGKGNFNFDLVPIPTGADGPVLVGDYNGDGYLDLIETSTGYILFGQANRTFRSSFSPGGAVPGGSGNSYAVADFDQDGKDDVAIANSNTIFIWLSRGDGTFIPKSVLTPTPTGIVQDLTTGDFNGDGIPDLATGLFLGPQDVVLFINDGRANFARTSFASGAATVSIVAADFNGDGKSDLAYANYTVSFRPPNVFVMLAGGAPSSTIDFTLTRGARTGQTVTAGEASGAYDLIVTPGKNSAAQVSLVCQGLPAGATCQFSPAVPVELSSGPVLVSVSVQTTAGVTPPGTYPFVTLGKASNVTRPAEGPFNLTVTSTLPNLAISIAPPSSPPAVGNPHSYHLSITNSGAETATAVRMQLSFSLAGSVSSASSQQGTCTLGPPVQCSLGSLTVGQTITADVTAVFMPDGVSPVSNPILTVTATITENEQDAVQADNTASLVETVGDFQLIANPSTMTVTVGQSAGYTVSVAPRQLAPRWGPFAASVALTCSSLPPESTCNFSPSSVTPGASSVPVALSVATTKVSAALIPSTTPGVRVFASVTLPFVVACLAVLSSRKRRKQFATVFFLLVLVELAVTLGSCNGGSAPPPPPPPPGGTPPGTYMITITGTSGIAQRSTQVTIVVQ